MEREKYIAHVYGRVGTEGETDWADLRWGVHKTASSGLQERIGTGDLSKSMQPRSQGKIVEPYQKQNTSHVRT